MAEITRFVLVDADDTEGDYEYPSLAEAMADAGDDHAVVMRTYVYDDSELVWTPDGGQVWPPQVHERDRDEDDGQTYGHPADELDERLRGD